MVARPSFSQPPQAPACRRSCPRVWAAFACAVVAISVQAQYKVVGPDGKITYTDRAPGPEAGRVMSLKGKAIDEPVDAVLPFELRQVVAKYPVTLYT
ncbi:MAG: NrdH-redoxin, partial [Pseudomonadota bacterium]|nr:NrdH-redoxin [Pseudomonadota bacterium]